MHWFALISVDICDLFKNLFHLLRSAQLCFLPNGSYLALTASASKHGPKTIICRDVGSYFQGMQI